MIALEVYYLIGTGPFRSGHVIEYKCIYIRFPSCTATHNEINSGLWHWQEYATPPLKDNLMNCNQDNCIC